MWKWVLGATILIILYLYYCHGEVSDIPFLGLKPFTDSLRKRHEYLDVLLEGYNYVKEAGAPVTMPSRVPTPAQPTSQPPAATTLRTPAYWDFRDITGAQKRERICRRILETLLAAPFPSIRPDWLRNPRTGRKLEIDCYNEECGLAVEVSGSQHFYYDERSLHRSREEFLAQVYRDRIKKAIILERGIDFLVVPYTVRTQDLPSYITDKLQVLGWNA